VPVVVTVVSVLVVIEEAVVTELVVTDVVVVVITSMLGVVILETLTLYVPLPRLELILDVIRDVRVVVSVFDIEVYATSASTELLAGMVIV
jgi:hypothetical protein